MKIKILLSVIGFSILNIFSNFGVHNFIFATDNSADSKNINIDEDASDDSLDIDISENININKNESSLNTNVKKNENSKINQNLNSVNCSCLNSVNYQDLDSECFKNLIVKNYDDLINKDDKNIDHEYDINESNNNIHNENDIYAIINNNVNNENENNNNIVNNENNNNIMNNENNNNIMNNENNNNIMNNENNNNNIVNNKPDFLNKKTNNNSNYDNIDNLNLSNMSVENLIDIFIKKLTSRPVIRNIDKNINLFDNNLYDSKLKNIASHVNYDNVLNNNPLFQKNFVENNMFPNENLKTQTKKYQYKFGKNYKDIQKGLFADISLPNLILEKYLKYIKEYILNNLDTNVKSLIDKSTVFKNMYELMLEQKETQMGDLIKYSFSVLDTLPEKFDIRDFVVVDNTSPKLFKFLEKHLEKRLNLVLKRNLTPDEKQLIHNKLIEIDMNSNSSICADLFEPLDNFAESMFDEKESAKNILMNIEPLFKFDEEEKKSWLSIINQHKKIDENRVCFKAIKRTIIKQLFTKYIGILKNLLIKLKYKQIIVSNLSDFEKQLLSNFLKFTKEITPKLNVAYEQIYRIMTLSDPVKFIKKINEYLQDEIKIKSNEELNNMLTKTEFYDNSNNTKKEFKPVLPEVIQLLRDGDLVYVPHIDLIIDFVQSFQNRTLKTNKNEGYVPTPEEINFTKEIKISSNINEVEISPEYIDLNIAILNRLNNYNHRIGPFLEISADRLQRCLNLLKEQC